MSHCLYNVLTEATNQKDVYIKRIFKQQNALNFQTVAVSGKTQTTSNGQTQKALIDLQKALDSVLYSILPHNIQQVEA